MRFFHLTLLVCFLLIRTTSAVRDYSLGLAIGNENIPRSVCTDAELDDLANRLIPTIMSVMADPKYDLKSTKESDWRIYKAPSAPTNNRKERDLQCKICPTGYYNPYICIGQGGICGRLLRIERERELSDIEVLEIKSNTEGAVRGLLNKFVNTSPYSKECTKALIGATISSTLAIVD